MILGAQFYTLRDFCKTTEGLDETMKKVADMAPSWAANGTTSGVFP